MHLSVQRLVRCFLAALACLAIATSGLPAAASEPNIQLCNYDDLGTPIRINFEDPRIESETLIDDVFGIGDVAFGESFSPRRPNIFDSWYTRGAYDNARPDAASPLRVYSGTAEENLALVKTNESQMLAGLGPPPDFLTGNGSISFGFHHAQVAVGFKVFALGGKYKGGTIRIHVFDTSGTHLSYIYFEISGASRVALCTQNGLPVIGGITISNVVPGGIAIDDIKYGHAAMIS